MYRFEKYTKNKDYEWDAFINFESANGTFLQTRKFLNYHPDGKFSDCSLLVYDEKDKLVAVCPACEIISANKGEKIFYSHRGSTFGGIVVSKKIYKARYIIPLLEEFEQYLMKDQYSDVFIKITPDIYSIERSALLEYAFYYQHYDEYKELNPYIDYRTYAEKVETNFSQGKRTHVHKCQRNVMIAETLTTDTQIKEYYQILCENLSKYNVKPVHSCEELLLFKNSLLKDQCEFFGVYMDKEMIAGGMMFYFDKTKTAHTQYLSAKTEYLRISPVTYLYYWIINEMKTRGYNTLSWGICTENYGRYLNNGLISSKEDFGSTYSNNLTYFKHLGGAILLYIGIKVDCCSSYSFSYEERWTA